MSRSGKPSQEKRILGVLLAAGGGWVCGEYFLRDLMFSQFHRAINTLEKKAGVPIEHSKFKNEHGYVSYRIPSGAVVSEEALGDETVLY